MTTVSPPVSPQPSEARPRAHTAMSFSSQRSRRSDSSATKTDLTEASKDKRRLYTKADPSRAITEATPAEQAQEASTVDDLRSTMHKDHDGNLITDPDRSNPTRHRLERPLDTIRAFNAAAEGTSSRRASYHRPGSQVGMNGDAGRRTSYYSNNGYSPQRPRMSPGGGYYRNSSYGLGPQSAVEETPGAAQMYARPPVRQQHSHPYNGFPNGPQNGHQNGSHIVDSPMSAHSYQHSYETMTSGSDEYGKSTNPSSQNSSFDQLHQPRKPEEYGHENPYANDINFGGPLAPPVAFSPTGPSNGGYGQEAPPGVPPKGFVPPPANNPRQLIKLSTSTPEAPEPINTKKQSWIKRRFSRREN